MQNQNIYTLSNSKAEHSSSGKRYLFLDKLNLPTDIRKLSIADLAILADEVRDATIAAVSVTGGHLGAGLGVVELTTALHYVFDTPKDLLVWDVGHQSYPHKILTGRLDRMNTLRMEKGLSGFPKRCESEYDTFGVGHSSTSISAALGMAVARDFKGEDNEVIAVIGDGAISAGMAYEAMNNSGALKKRLIVILNDNEMSISKPVGAMSAYLSELASSKQFLTIRNMAKKFVNNLPEPLSKVFKNAEHYAKSVINEGSNLFEDLGFYYLGPVDGHNISHLVPILENVRDDKLINKPILIHVITEKGRGFSESHTCPEKFHAVSKFDKETKEQIKPKTINPSYTKIFAESLVECAKEDKNLIAITAAMPSGTGLDLFAKHFKERMFDVGIAEQHAVTFAAGMAANGMNPFVCLYSTFLQRAYDQVIHDVAIQNLPVKFAIDRAGFVGQDGATHAGCFDIAYLSILPNFVIMAPSCGNELILMTKFAADYTKGPIALRFPRGESTSLTLETTAIELGKGRIVKKGMDIAIISFGTRLAEVLNAAAKLREQDIDITVIDARFAKPIDKELILETAKSHSKIITIEEGSFGGFGAIVNQLLIDNDLTKDLTIKNLYFADKFYDHASMESQYKQVNMDADSIVTLAKNLYL